MGAVKLSSLRLTRTVCQKPSGANLKRFLRKLSYYGVFMLLLALAIVLFLNAQWDAIGLTAGTTGMLVSMVVVTVLLLFFLGLASIVFESHFQGRESNDHPCQAGQ
jgi:membrane-bound acyltransferase YfiQ involved in biofilm formation